MLAELKPAESSEFIRTAKTIRVLHIVENLDNQAVESWLLRVARAAAPNYAHVHWTFFCVLGKEGSLDALARNIGADVIHSRYEVGDKVRFMRSLREVMKTGNYDILHCHHDIMSAAYLAASVGLPFRKRIVHIHNTSLSLPTPSRVKAELVREPMRQMCLRMADEIVGISSDALRSLVGEGKRDPERHHVVHYAVDMERFFQAPVDREKFRCELGFPAEAKILLFVGRLNYYKNPSFVIEILEHAARADKNVIAVFAGVGHDARSISELAAQKSLSERVRLIGFRDDVPNLMVNSDVLIWPSVEEPKEGLGLGIVEAQAASLPVLMSRSVPAEAIVIPELIDVLPLAAGPKAWAVRVADILKRPPLSRQESNQRVEASSFSMAAGVSKLLELYHTRD
jgi:glycosyltransferase involved in cell wall biosynthesis